MMRTQKLVTALSLVVVSTFATSVSSSSAEACQPAPASAFLEASAPGVGQDDVPLDAALVTTFRLMAEWEGWTDEAIAELYWGDAISVELVDPDGAQVSGETTRAFPAIEDFYQSAFVTIVFEPEAALLPETTYSRRYIKTGSPEVLYEDTFTTASVDAPFSAPSWDGGVAVEYTEEVSEDLACCPSSEPYDCEPERCGVVGYDYDAVLRFSIEGGVHPLGSGAISYEVQQLAGGPEPVWNGETVDPAGEGGRPYGEGDITPMIPVANTRVEACYQVVAYDAVTGDPISTSSPVCVTADDFQPVERRDESELGLECGDVADGGGTEGGGTEGGGTEGGGTEGGGTEGGGGAGGDQGSDGGGCSTTPAQPSPLAMLILLGCAILGLRRRQPSRG